MKRPRLRRRVTTYTVVSWEVAWEDDEQSPTPPAAAPAEPAPEPAEAEGAPGAEPSNAASDEGASTTCTDTD